MSKVEVKEDTQTYKSMRLVSANLVVEVKEKRDFSHTNLSGERVEQIEPAEVSIYHSPSKFKDDGFHVYLRNRTELKEYIQMLQDFEKKFGHYLDEVQV